MNNDAANNIAIGYQAGKTIHTLAHDNIFIGHTAGNAAGDADFNIGIGSDALQVLGAEANYNIGIGGNVLNASTTAVSNTAIGHATMKDNITGDNNIALGYNAGRTADNDGCVYIGYEAGKNNVADNRFYINNSDSAFPLIYGEFDNDVVKFGDNSAAWNIQFMQSRIHMLETTTPGAIVNYGAIYCKADNKLYFQDGAGAEHEVAFV